LRGKQQGEQPNSFGTRTGRGQEAKGGRRRRRRRRRREEEGKGKHFTYSFSWSKAYPLITVRHRITTKHRH